MKRFGTTPAGDPVELHRLESELLAVELVSYGATIRSLEAPDRGGRRASVVLGFPDLAGYLGSGDYVCCVVGRFANRIGGGSFELDGERVRLARNDGAHHLHGGRVGFGHRVWDTAAADDDSVSFRLASRDGDEGYPGALVAEATYRLAGDELRLELRATADRATIVNLTSHLYVNLAGAGDVLAHELEVAADELVPVDADGIPTGGTAPLAGTALDFRAPVALRERVAAAALGARRGLDHCLVLRPGARPAARLRDPASGRVLELETTAPGLQLYSGQGLPVPFGGLALEAQGFPDAPNRPEFPSCVLRPGEEYRSLTVLRLGCS